MTLRDRITTWQAIHEAVYGPLSATERELVAELGRFLLDCEQPPTRCQAAQCSETAEVFIGPATGANQAFCQQHAAYVGGQP